VNFGGPWDDKIAQMLPVLDKIYLYIRMTNDTRTCIGAEFWEDPAKTVA